MSNGEQKVISISTGTILRVLFVILGVLVIWKLWDLVLVILTSIVIASFISSVVPHFKKIGVGRIFGTVLLYVLGIVFLAIIFYLFAPLLITEIYNLAKMLANYAPGLDFLNYFKNEAFSGAKDIVANMSNKLSLDTLLSASKAFVDNLSSGFFTTLSVAFGSIFNVILIIIISFYLSIQEKGVEDFLQVMVPRKYEDYALDLWIRSKRKIALWVRGQMLVALLVAVLTYLALSLLSIPYALLLSIIVGFLQLVPYGVLLAVIPAVSFSYLSGGLTSALLVAGVYLIVHQFESYLFTPLIIRRVVGLSPLAIILSILIGVKLAGFWGLILAIPGAVVFMELIGDVQKKRVFAREKNG